MPREFFDISRTASLCTLEPGAKIHVTGVCGVAMAQLSCALTRRGYQVSGSDSDFWEPMGSILKRSSVRLSSGFDRRNIPPDVSLVIIGNAIRYGNPEVLRVEEEGLPYSLFPKVLYELVISGRHSIVISGTHGKTTTTAMCAHVLRAANADPAWFFGGAAEQFSDSLWEGGRGFSVVEGDEYDSAFFAKVPKFNFYSPDTLVVTSIEYDHADIYPDLESIKGQFTALAASMPSGSRIIAYEGASTIRELLPEWKRICKAEVLTYGGPASDYRLVKRIQGPDQQEVVVSGRNGKEQSLLLSLGGSYNALNAVSVFAACVENGQRWEDIAPAFPDFSGVKRRQELRYSGPVILIEDFAHHPTAVRETLRGLRERFPERRIVAVFEPRSNTSRRKIFEEEYAKALSAADAVMLTRVVARHNDEGIELMSVEGLCAALRVSGTSAQHFPDYSSTEKQVLSEAREGDVIVIMSNGSFGGIIPRIEEGLRAAFPKPVGKREL